MRVQLISPLPDRGFAFNQGVYWPVGLLTVGSYLNRLVKDIDVEIFDYALGAEDQFQLDGRIGGDVVGIQASSCLTYSNVLRTARIAKENGAKVILGGAFASDLAQQILRCREFIDAVVVGPGEKPMTAIVEALARGSTRASDLTQIPGVFCRIGDKVIGTDADATFDYDDARPLDYSLIPVRTYHRNYGNMNPHFDGAFQIFTHFGCKYRDLRRRAGKEWCTYCSLSSDSVLRRPESVCQEIREALESAAIKPGARLMLKCYGDNASAIGAHLQSLAEAIQADEVLSRFDLRWSLYAQSSYVSARLVDIFRRLRVWEVYIGFDSGDDTIQLLNGLGTTVKSHINSARLLRDAGIRIQAGFVLGCAGETKETIEATTRLAFSLAELGNVDLFHASPLVVLPGSPAFRMLCSRIPTIRDMDLLDTTWLQHEWIRHFCPRLGDADVALTYLDETARNIVALGRLASSFGGWAERQ